MEKKTDSVRERNYSKFTNVANDRFTHRSANKYIEKQAYTFNPPFGARDEGLPIDVLVPKAFVRPISPMVERFPPPSYNPYQSITKCDFKWSASNPQVRSRSPGQERPRVIDLQALNAQRSSCDKLSKPNFQGDNRLVSARKSDYPEVRVNRFIEQRKGTSSKGWLPTY